MNILRGGFYFLEWGRHLPNLSDWPVLDDWKFLQGGFCFDVEKGSRGVCFDATGYPHPVPEACVFQDRENSECCRMASWIWGGGVGNGFFGTIPIIPLPL